VIMVTILTGGPAWESRATPEKHYELPGDLDGPPIDEWTRGRRRYSDPEVRAIRAAFMRGWTHRQIADYLMVPDRTVSSIVNRHSYRKVADDGPTANLSERAGAPPDKPVFRRSFPNGSLGKLKFTAEQTGLMRRAHASGVSISQVARD